MTKSQIKWASEHDWFIKDNFDGSILVRGEYEGDDNFNISDFNELRDYAGY